MKFGICVGVNQIKYLKEIDCDYAEVSLAGIADMSDEEFEKLYEENAKSDVKIEAANGFFPAHIRVVWPDFNAKQIAEYTNLALGRASRLGIDTCILGSGRSRKYSEGYSHEKAIEDFSNALRIVGDIAGRYNIVVGIEPLSYAETNVVNTVLDALEVSRRVGSDYIKVMADFFHMMNNKEDLNSLKEVGKDLVHVHVSAYSIPGRPAPASPTEDRYQEFFDILREIGFEGRISVEAVIRDLVKEGKTALEVLRSV
ncbi:MAG TPA: sugar phosphate isomerase/epimerase [Clostridiaceae bacterium]|jgi:D-psicose/D-tagatose/L-ribulose 3-epimerase|nr:sugar phosphate isomerase/epimerase [Clostridiaceae bacterium]